MSEPSTTMDKMGIWISSLCAVHCLALPILPILATTIFGEVWFERTILSISLVIGMASLLMGTIRHHGKYYPFLLLISGGLIYWNKGFLGDDWEPITVAVGAALIIAGHWINLRLCRQCRCCHNSLFDSTPSSVAK